MKAIIAKIQIQPGKEAEFEAFAAELCSQVDANEPGNHLYKLSKTAEGGYKFIEIYEDDAAIAAHRESAHYKAAGPKFMGVLAGKPEIEILDVL